MHLNSKTKGNLTIKVNYKASQQVTNITTHDLLNMQPDSPDRLQKIIQMKKVDMVVHKTLSRNKMKDYKPSSK